MAYDFVTGDTGSRLQVTCKDSATGNAMSVAGATVRLRWEDANGDIATRTMTISDAAAGVVYYQFAANELIAPKMRFEVEVTDVSNNVVTGLDLIEVTVREQMG